MIVMAEPAEIIERNHFKVGTPKRSQQFLANCVKDASAGGLLNPLRETFLAAGRTFLRSGFVACLASVNGTLLVAANVKHCPRLRSVNHDGRPRLRTFGFFCDAAVLAFV